MRRLIETIEMLEAKRYKDFDWLARRLKDMIDSNYYSESLYELVKFLGYKKYEKIIESILLIKKIEGYAPRKIKEYESDLIGEIERLAKKDLAKEDFNKLAGLVFSG